jgi:hypothetical protein
MTILSRLSAAAAAAPARIAGTDVGDDNEQEQPFGQEHRPAERAQPDGVLGDERADMPAGIGRSLVFRQKDGAGNDAGGKRRNDQERRAPAQRRRRSERTGPHGAAGRPPREQGERHPLRQSQVTGFTAGEDEQDRRERRERREQQERVVLPHDGEAGEEQQACSEEPAEWMIEERLERHAAEQRSGGPPAALEPHDPGGDHWNTLITCHGRYWDAFSPTTA